MAAAAAAGAGEKEMMMNTSAATRTWRRWPLVAGVAASLSVIATSPLDVQAQSAVGAPRATQAAAVRSFETPKAAADALLAAATAFDVAALKELFGPQLEEIVLTDTPGDNRRRAAEFVK